MTLPLAFLFACATTPETFAVDEHDAWCDVVESCLHGWEWLGYADAEHCRRLTPAECDASTYDAEAADACILGWQAVTCQQLQIGDFADVEATCADACAPPE